MDLCVCGQNIGQHDTHSKLSSPDCQSMMASFVHLPNDGFMSRGRCDRGFQAAHDDILLLEKVLLESDESPDLCLQCIKRVEKALNEETERLDGETKLYMDETTREENRLRSMKSTLEVATAVSSNDDASGRMADLVAEVNDLKLMTATQRAELIQLRHLFHEQSTLSDEIDTTEALIDEEQNALELEAKAFDLEHEDLCGRLLEQESRLEGISSENIRWPSLIMEIQIDPRGLRYPLINELRLAYRPKGDLGLAEVQAAWSLAANLLKIIGTLFQFPSPEWKIIPLAHCAKLIRYAGGNGGETAPIFFSLGNQGPRANEALLAWNCLISEVIEDVSTKLNQAHSMALLDVSSLPKLPFPMDANCINNVDLTLLSGNDDGCWSRVIHCHASNLQWLSACTSAHVLKQVQLASLTMLSC